MIINKTSYNLQSKQSINESKALIIRAYLFKDFDNQRSKK